MKRIVRTPRKHWEKKVESFGFGFHSLDCAYWDESQNINSICLECSQY